MTPKQTERVHVSRLGVGDIVVLGDTELPLTDVVKPDDNAPVRLYFKGDPIGVNLDKNATVSRVVREELDIELPFGTLVTCFGLTGVKTAEYGWIVVNRKDRWSHWDDKIVNKLIRAGRVTLVFNPNDNKEA